MSLDLTRFHDTFFEGEPSRFASTARRGGDRAGRSGNAAVTGSAS